MIRPLKLLTITETSIDALKRRIVKMWNGNHFTATAVQYGPFGSDSNPPVGTVAIYGRTEMDGKEVCIGTMSKNFLAAPGEYRTFSTDPDVVFKFNVWLRADGTALIGDSDSPEDYNNFLVNFNELKTEFNALKSSHNDLVTKFNTHTHIYSPGPGAPAPTAPVTSQATPNSSNIDNAKNSKIKTI